MLRQPFSTETRPDLAGVVLTGCVEMVPAVTFRAKSNRMEYAFLSYNVGIEFLTTNLEKLATLYQLLYRGAAISAPLFRKRCHQFAFCHLSLIVAFCILHSLPPAGSKFSSPLPSSFRKEFCSSCHANQKSGAGFDFATSALSASYKFMSATAKGAPS